VGDTGGAVALRAKATYLSLHMGELARVAYPPVSLQPRVLVVDDDGAIRILLTTILRRNGFDVDIARDGQEALEMVASMHYGVILLDLMMPRLDGLDVLEYLDGNEGDSPKRCVIVLTAAAGKDLSRLDGQRVFRVLRKPFDMSELMTTVRECIAASARPGTNEPPA
jgi:two-component system response regulator MprA